MRFVSFIAIIRAVRLAPQVFGFQLVEGQDLQTIRAGDYPTLLIWILTILRPARVYGVWGGMARGH